ncbi:MAG: helix-turn-helix domain-containing protein, partial [Lachnospiraceae bacterium]|nr:helix-turn-helix domain-containing protein [Lachnospiraceae bacterium]
MTLEEQLPLFQALSSELRVQILKLVVANSGISLKHLAEKLNMPQSTLSPHISKLAACGLIRVEEEPASHGVQKCCYPKMSQILVDFGDSCNRLPLY